MPDIDERPSDQAPDVPLLAGYVEGVEADTFTAIVGEGTLRTAKPDAFLTMKVADLDADEREYLTPGAYLEVRRVGGEPKVVFVKETWSEEDVERARAQAEDLAKILWI